MIKEQGSSDHSVQTLPNGDGPNSSVGLGKGNECRGREQRRDRRGSTAGGNDATQLRKLGEAITSQEKIAEVLK
jgi:hypothetical protein